MQQMLDEIEDDTNLDDLAFDKLVYKLFIKLVILFLFSTVLI